MDKFRIRKIKEKKIIWMKFRNYIDFIILVCCGIVAFNIHPSSVIYGDDDSIKVEKSKMIYVFHDYEWNEYVMNDNVHWSSSSWEYLLDEDVPSDLKWEEKQLNNDAKNDNIKDNQVSIDDIMVDLWLENENTSWDNTNSWNKSTWNDEEYYKIHTDSNSGSESLIIEKIDNDKKNDDSEILSAKTFTFVEDWWVLPVLVSWDQLDINNNSSTISYTNSSGNKKSGVTIIDDYEKCMTPWWYKIEHWESVLAYQQIDDTPDICNIERRFCWKWKLSGTYTQQWCYINENYTYEEIWWKATPNKTSQPDAKDNRISWSTKQNSDGSVSVKSDEIWWSFVFDRPNNSYTEYLSGDNIRPDDEEVEQTSRPYRDCVTPRWEKVEHGLFIQAFKHENWFTDAPCEMQFRKCSLWKLMWTYTESSCRSWDVSFIDWINGVRSSEDYSKEKLDLIKKQIKNDNKKVKDYWRSTDSDSLDKILYILDK